MKMRKGIFNLLFCTFVFLSLPVLAQQSTLLEKYRTMALDYNHDLKAAEKNIAASMEVEKSARADLKPKLSGAASFQSYGTNFGYSFHRVVENSGRKEFKLWRFSVYFTTGLYGRACTGVHPYGATSAGLGR
jgi:hypothetical protein